MYYRLSSFLFKLKASYGMTAQKTVLFVINTMNVGGVEKALLGVINKFLKDNWEVHIGMLKVGGDFLPYLPKSVIVHSIDGFDEVKPILHTPLRESAKNYLKKWHIFEAILMLIFYASQKISGSSKALYNYGLKRIPMFSNQEFDLAVAFAGPDAFIDTYVSKRIKAKEKWGWIHFDITKFGIDKGIIQKEYKNYSRINIVSNDAKDIFDKNFPVLADKTAFQPNIVDSDSILTMADEDLNIIKDKNKTIILTVGRISQEKGQYMALQSLKEIVDTGIRNIEWWFVGTGTDYKRCHTYVMENNLSEYVKFYGVQTNPYPYMKACDIYVQPSLHEGFCITLAEAKLFKMPIITTDFTGAKEQLTDYPKYRIIRYSISEMNSALTAFIKA